MSEVWRFVNDNDGTLVILDGDYPDVSSVQDEASSQGQVIRGGTALSTTTLVMVFQSDDED